MPRILSLQETMAGRPQVQAGDTVQLRAKALGSIPRAAKERKLRGVEGSFRKTLPRQAFPMKASSSVHKDHSFLNGLGVRQL